MDIVANMPAGDRAELFRNTGAQMDLEAALVEHKTKFYYSAWARYDLAVPGTFALVPTEERLAALRRDYNAMSVMMFGDLPPVEAVLEMLADLEDRINSRADGVE